MEEYIITISTTTCGETVTITNVGKVVEEYGHKKISYSEESGETEINLCDDQITVVRRGEIHSVMCFKNGEESDMILKTVYGELPISVKSNSVSHFFDGDKYGMKIDYELLFGDKKQGYMVEMTAVKL